MKLFITYNLTALKSLHPREFAIQGKKKITNARGEGGGGGECWAQLELTDALIEIFVRQKTQREEPETFLLQQITYVTWKTCILV